MRLQFVQRKTVGDDSPVVTLIEVLLKMANVGVSMTEVIQISLLVSLSILNMFQQRYNVRYFMKKKKKDPRSLHQNRMQSNENRNQGKTENVNYGLLDCVMNTTKKIDDILTLNTEDNVPT
jgi:hypothetical protein